MHNATIQSKGSPKDIHGNRRCSAVDCAQDGVCFVMHYLDNFMLIGAPNTPKCAEDLGVLLQIFERLGLPTATNKLEGPTFYLNLLGFQMDMGAMENRISQEKMQELQKLLAE